MRNRRSERFCHWRVKYLQPKICRCHCPDRESEKELQDLLDKVVEESNKKGPTVN